MVRRQLARMLRAGDRYQCSKRGDNAPGDNDSRRDAHALKDRDYLCHQLLEYEKGQTITVFGYKRNLCKTILSNIFVVLTLGILPLVFHWFPKFWIRCTHDKDTLKHCQRLLIEDNYKGKWTTYATVPIELLSLPDGAKQVYYLKDNVLKESDTVIFFTYKSIRFVLEDAHFEPLCGISDGLPQNVLHGFPGLTESERISRLNIYGSNEIKVPMTPILQLVLLEILTPFYVFQIASLTLWIVEGYVYFVIVIVVLTVLGVGGHVYQTRKNESNLRKRVKAKDTIKIYTREEVLTKEASSTELVPGDLVQLSEGYAYCDAILLSGTCLVDESMLTGESIQVLKTPIPNNANLQNREDSAPHMLFAGTRIVQANSELKALVITTGFLTSKGSLIRSIMYPPPMDYAFDRDCTKFCIVTFLIGVGCAVHIALSKQSRGIPMYDLVIKTLDSITILLPAALPATLTIGKLHALKNLKKKEIFCTNSKVLTNCGSIDVVCLDKTGTITEDNLDFIGIVSKGSGGIQKEGFSETVERGMALCHNLATYEGVLQGDHLEVQMFTAVSATILAGDATVSLASGQVLKIMARNQFSSNLRRMSVIVQGSTLEADYEVFCKGSPEIIKALCSNPSDSSDEDLQSLTKQGYRVISLATRKLSGCADLDLGTMIREDVERDLVFLGYLVFENKLKPGSKEIIEELKRGNLAIKMITGDNIETAISVAKECGILPEHENVKVLLTLGSLEHLKSMFKVTDHFGITGVVWNQLLAQIARDPELLEVCLPKIQVFARMASQQKQQVVEQYQSLGLNVCMCGDGANDCSALKAANVGISLTESESSMAAHLTSRVQNISAVLDIVREGRSALVTTVSIVKINVSANIIQYIGLLLLYELDASYADLQFLYLDLHMLIYGFFIGYVDAYAGPLCPTRPTSSLIAWKPTLSMLGQLVPTILFQFVALWMLRAQPWFVPYVHNPQEGNNFRSFENYVVFMVALFQYGTLAVVFSRGKPYRKPIWTNWILCGCMVAYLMLDLTLDLSNVQWLLAQFDLMVPPVQDFRWQVIAIGLAHFTTAIVIEEVFIEYLLERYILDQGQNKGRRDKDKAKTILV